MNFLLCMVIAGLVVVAIVFATVDSVVSKKENEKIFYSLVSGISKVVFDISIGLIIIVIPMTLLTNYLKPQPEDIMPAFYYDGKYVEIDDMDLGLAELLIEESTETIAQDHFLSAYYDRAYLYFYTSNYDLAYEDLQLCFEYTNEWKYSYDLGVVLGYMLDYKASINYFEKTLEMNIPLSDRGIVRESLTLIKSYYSNWIFSLLE